MVRFVNFIEWVTLASMIHIEAWRIVKRYAGYAMGVQWTPAMIAQAATGPLRYSAVIGRKTLWRRLGECLDKITMGPRLNVRLIRERTTGNYLLMSDISTAKRFGNIMIINTLLKLYSVDLPLQ